MGADRNDGAEHVLTPELGGPMIWRLRYCLEKERFMLSDEIGKERPVNSDQVLCIRPEDLCLVGVAQ